MSGQARPQLSFLQIWNMCFGFLGLQFGFALQNANVSRIFQTLGATLDQIPALWTAAPLTGLLVQPIVGYYSDRTWSSLGRRRPYFLVGAVLATAALVVMPRSGSLWIAACTLWLLDASINISMEPFRALVADQLSPAQRPQGYAMQSFFIGLGAIVASMLPWLLTKFGVGNDAHAVGGVGAVPDSVRWSFDVGAVVLLLAVMWTVLRTREYPPNELTGFRDSTPDTSTATSVAIPPLSWVGAGMLILAGVWYRRADPQLNLVGAMALLWGLAGLIYRRGRGSEFFRTVMTDIAQMPTTMRRLIWVQFFSWTALFSMWIYSTPAVALRHFGSADPLSAGYNEGANWVGVLFAAYNGFAALAAALIPLMVARAGMRVTHLINMSIGGVALVSFFFIKDPNWLLLSMMGVGLAWASILSLPYALLASSVPARKMGTYMGIFNLFIVIPQLLAASVLGALLHALFGGNPIYALVLGGISFVIAGVLSLRVPEQSRSRELGEK